MIGSKIYFVFDVESIGLHGEGFAVGFVVVNEFGIEVSKSLIACPRESADGVFCNREWVNKNIPEIKAMFECKNPKEVRDHFWREWMAWKEHGAIMVADCAWPVEARFLEACVSDSPSEREWQGPYPLHDLASILLCNGKNPLDKFPRMENELPEHNPLCDARQSARILIENISA